MYSDSAADAESEEGLPPPGEAGSCGCGQIASPSCDSHLCAACCRSSTCPRHGDAPPVQQQQQQSEDDTGSYMSDGDDYAAPAAAAAQQQLRCRRCGQMASQRCTSACCRQCCTARHCPYHNSYVITYDSSAAAAQDSDDSDYEWGYNSNGGGPSQQQQIYCIECGQPAASACTIRCCADCCDDYASCTRHYPGVPEVFGDALLDIAVQLRNLSVRDATSAGVGAGGAGAGGAGASSSSAGAAAAAAAGAAAAAAACSSSSGGGGACPKTEAEEALFQLKHCIVCLDEPRSVLILPCKHLVLCGGCMLRMQRQVRQEFAEGSSDNRDVQCPVCREPAVSMLPGIILS